MTDEHNQIERQPTQTEQATTTPDATGTTESQSQQQPTEEPTEAKQEDNGESKADIPESFDAYSVELDGFDFDGFKSSEANQGFLQKAHELGMTNTQMNAVLGAFQQHMTVQVEQLQSEWGTEFGGNLQFAQQAVQGAGLSMDDVDSPTFGIKLAAYYGKQLQEDMPPLNTQPTATEDARTLMASEAYMNPSHPDHHVTYAKVQKIYENMNR